MLLALMLVGQKSLPDRIAEACIVLFAAGGVLLGELSRPPGRRWLRIAMPTVLLLSGAALAPVGLPLLPPNMMARYTAVLGIVPPIEKGEDKYTQLPQWFADSLGWEQLVDDVASVADEMSLLERRSAVIIAPSYGQAGAIELLGRGRELPPVYATQNSCWHWGPPDGPVDVAIMMGPFDEGTVSRLFSDVRLVRTHDCDWCTPWRDQAPLWLVRGSRVPIALAWPLLRHYE